MIIHDSSNASVLVLHLLIDILFLFIDLHLGRLVRGVWLLDAGVHGQEAQSGAGEGLGVEDGLQL